MSSKKPVFKESFKSYFKNLLGDELDAFIEACKKPLLESIRVNTIKIDKKRLKGFLEEKGWVLEDIPFYNDGLIVLKRDSALGNSIEHFMGYYYVQEQSSMIPPLVLEPKQKDVVLDCCASPGSKTSQLSQLMNSKGVIIANDKDYRRIKILQSNLQRCSCRNTIITLSRGQKFKHSNEVFDKILVDAPCTGYGAIRKDWSILKLFNPRAFKYMSRVQLELLNSTWNSLKKGGSLVYSTCTLTTEENEGVIKNFLNTHEDAGIKKIRIKGLSDSPGIGLKEAVRIWPHRIDMEGFFVAKLVKK